MKTRLRGVEGIKLVQPQWSKETPKQSKGKIVGHYWPVFPGVSGDLTRDTISCKPCPREDGVFLDYLI